MSYFAWLLLMALCGWIAGQVVGGRCRDGLISTTFYGNAAGREGTSRGYVIAVTEPV
jgi:uncharacterized membrane protein YeaQ/YmgE (transglycosylase-associated protein family)